MGRSCRVFGSCSHAVEATPGMGKRLGYLGARGARLRRGHRDRCGGSMRICHVAYAYFPADPRVRREVDALRGAGYDVEVICLRGENEAGVETLHGTRITRIPLRARRGGSARHAFPYISLFLLSFAEAFRV